MPASTTNAPQHQHLSNGGRLVTTDGRTLPLRQTRLRATAVGGIARVCLQQTFYNPYDEPLTVTYQLPLPADGAVSGFAFCIADRRVVGEVDGRSAARDRFEEAIATGHSAALLEQERSSLFSQEIGNIPPGTEIVAEITVDQPLAWLDGGQWEWRFPTALAPRYLGPQGRVKDSGRVAVNVAANSIAARLAFELTVDDELANGTPSSPSHRVMTTQHEGRTRIALIDEDGCRLDRDVVVRWPVATDHVQTTLAVAGRGAASGTKQGRTGEANDAFGLLTIVPPSSSDSNRSNTSGIITRDVIALIDTSGSMHGAPLSQAQHIVKAIVNTLNDGDRLELIEFSSQARHFKKHPVVINCASRTEALGWIDSLQAGGCTEMHQAISAALAPINAESQRQVILVTDGMIGFEQEIVGEIMHSLPRSSRVHTVGVGSSVNRSLTAAAARAGHGIEVILGIDEDPTLAAQRIVARTALASVVDLTVQGDGLIDHAPQHLPDLFAGAPARIAVRLRDAGGEVVVRGRTTTGTFEQKIWFDAIATDAGRSAIRTLYGREMVEDLEMQIAAGTSADEIDQQIEAVGLRYQLATRLTSWIAVSEQVTVDPRSATRREHMPQELPHGMSIAGMGLRCAGGMEQIAMSCPPSALAPGSLATDLSAGDSPTKAASKHRSRRLMKKRGLLGGLLGGDSSIEDLDEENFIDGAQPIDSADEAPLFEPIKPPVLRGRVTVQREGLLVIEFDATGLDPADLDTTDHNWQIPDDVTVRFDDGSEVRTEIVIERTTAPGIVPAGAVIRLTLRLPDNTPTQLPTQVLFDQDDQQHVVELTNLNAPPSA